MDVNRGDESDEDSYIMVTSKFQRFPTANVEIFFTVHVFQYTYIHCFFFFKKKEIFVLIQVGYNYNYVSVLFERNQNQLCFYPGQKYVGP